MARLASISLCVSAAAALAWGAACGSIPDDRKVLDTASGGSEADGGDDSGAGGTSSGGKGSGGFGIGSGGKGVGNAGSDGGPLEAGASTVCGATTCSTATFAGTELSPCCAGSTAERCGLDFSTIVDGAGCIEVNAPGSVTAACPTRSDANGTYAGCCRSDTATCGVTFSAPGVNFGCVDSEFLSFPAGDPCTPEVCVADGGSCQGNSDCCGAAAGAGICANLDGAGLSCTRSCVSDADCRSGCCIQLISGFGACAPDASACGTGCRSTYGVCDSDADCCDGMVCVSNGSRGPRTCHDACTKASDCAPEFCLRDEVSGKTACTYSGQGLCTNTCYFANDGTCDDGGVLSEYRDCALGSDCADCAAATGQAARLEGVALDSDSCASAGNGRCEDGGDASVANTCDYGTDTADCGPRLGICSDDCPRAKNGICEDGTVSAASALCATGTDCSDCGTHFGGRGQSLCDGSQGTFCNPATWEPAWVGDGKCYCSDCAWDTADCNPGGLPVNCDGTALGYCCSEDNNCGYTPGICNCGGWCTWDRVDCGGSPP